MLIRVDDAQKRKDAAKAAARARWGEPRSVRLDDLTPAQRRLVLALIEAARESNRQNKEDSGGG